VQGHAQKPKTGAAGEVISTSSFVGAEDGASFDGWDARHGWAKKMRSHLMFHERRWMPAALLCAVLAGCGQPTSRLNAPPQGYSEHRHHLDDTYTGMVDNALLSDASIADLHFVPHTTELNALGTERLSRLARLLRTYGGTVRYETYLTDKEVVEERIAHVRDFLETTGIDMSMIEVAVAQPGASHTRADEAIAAAERGMEASHQESSGGEEGMGSGR